MGSSYYLGDEGESMGKVAQWLLKYVDRIGVICLKLKKLMLNQSICLMQLMEVETAELWNEWNSQRS